MKTVKLSDAKNSLSRYVEHVRRGGRVRILVRGVPAADLVPIAESSADIEPHLRELERQGLIRRGVGRIPDDLLRPGRKTRGRALSVILVEERSGGR
jgi:prevent-host-death family protein